MKNNDALSKSKSKISAIRKIYEQPKDNKDNVYDLVDSKDLLSTNGIIKRTLTDFSDKKKSKKTENRNIFSEIIETAESFLGSNTNIDNNEKPKIKSKIKKYAKDSAVYTLQSSKQIIVNNISNHFFSGSNACGSDITFINDSIEISPKEFDFLSMLTMSPDSTTGQFLYESISNDKIPFNRKMYELFNSNDTYIFRSNDNTELFNIRWNSLTQKYIISGLTNNNSLNSFINDYYSTIQFPTSDELLKNTMLLTIGSDGTETNSFNGQLNKLDRLLTKLFSLCGSPINETPLNQNTINQIEDDDEIDIESYFDFDDVDGIDIDSEKNRYNHVMSFIDCSDFESEISATHVEDFVYFVKKSNINDVTDSTINRIANDSYENSGQSIPLVNFQSSILSSYILAIPRAMILSIFTPKMLLPMVVLYKLTNGDVLSVTEIMQKMSNLFYQIIKQIFWRFISKLWIYIRKELVNFIRNIAVTILKNKLKRYKLILSALIGILTASLLKNIGSCDEIFNAILNTINTSLSSKAKLPIPGVLLSLSDTLPGYSPDRAQMNIIEKLSKSGIPTGDLYGRSNSLISVVKSIIDGNSEEIDEHSYIKIALKSSVAPSGPGGTVLSPLNVGVGKMF